MSFEIKHGLIIKASPDQVYQCLTMPKHLNNWWTLTSEGNPTIKTTYRFYFTPEYDWLATVIKATEHKCFEVKMIRSSKDWEPTSFGFELEPVSKGTQLIFYHKNWMVNNYHFQHTSYCWALLLKGLKDYIEKDLIIPFEQRA